MEIIYSNEAGETITLQSRRPFFLTKVEGAGEIKQDITTFKAPEQDGAFFVSGTLDTRNITLEGTLLADTVNDAYALRRKLLRIFTPKQKGTLLYRGRQIACVVEEASFSVSTGERNHAFIISLLCPSPFFADPEELRIELAAWEEAFYFPLEIPADGIEFGIRAPSQIMTVDNMGDVSCGCTILFKALGAVQNPELYCIDTDEYIRLNKTMANGEELRVKTYFAGKRVTSTLGGVTTNAFSCVDTGSVFLQLAPGRNLLRFSADENMELLEVTILYRPQYLGV